MYNQQQSQNLYNNGGRGMYNQQQNIYSNQNSQQKPEREKLRLRIDETEEFKSTIKTMVISSFDLGKKIRNLFTTAGVADLEGPSININPQTGQIELSLYFKPDLNGVKKGTHFVEQITAQQSQSTVGRLLRLNNRNTGRTLQLTQGAKDVLEELVVRGYNQKINWNSYTAEVCKQGYGYYNVYLKVYNLDINKVISKIWGDEQDGGSRLEYQVSVSRYIPGTNNVLLTIQQLSEKDIAELAAKSGIISDIGDFNIIR